MKISVKFYLLYVVFLILVSIMGYVLVFVFSQAENAINKTENVNEMLVNIFELDIVTNDYLMHKEERSLQQWFLKYDLIKNGVITHGRKFSSYNYTYTDKEKSFLNEMELNFTEASKIFLQISEGNISTELESILAGQISVKMQSIVSGAVKVFAISNEGIKTSKNQAFFVSFAILAVIVLLITIGVYIIIYAVSVPLKKLNEEVDTISSGKLSFKIDPKIVQSRDEIGKLANSFLLMAKKLKVSYEGLEQKVRERTLDLETVNAQDDAMLDNIGEGIVFVDTKGEVDYINNAGEKMLGRNRNFVLGRKWVEVAGVRNEKMELEDKSKIPLIEVLFADEKVAMISSNNLFYTKKNGNSFPVATTASRVMLKNKMIGAIVVFRDITLEKEIDKAKTEFVSLVSHQLRTPLTGIRWNTEILTKGKIGPTTIKQKKIISEIQKANARMLGLINALLNVSRLEAGTFIVEPKEENIIELAKGIVVEQKSTIKKKKLKFVTNFDKNLPERIMLDKQLTEIIFQNLLSNAIKYTPEKGNVKFEISNVKKAKSLGGQKIKENSILIKVTDSGVGIPEDEQKKIFSRMFRAKNVIRIGAEGTGLGLYIIKTIIDNTGGNIWFESKENKGTSFYITLPVEGMRAKGGTKKLE